MIKVIIKIDDSGWDDDPTDLDELKLDIFSALTQFGGIPSSDIDIEIEEMDD